MKIIDKDIMKIKKTTKLSKVKKTEDLMKYTPPRPQQFHLVQLSKTYIPVDDNIKINNKPCTI